MASMMLSSVDTVLLSAATNVSEELFVIRSTNECNGMRIVFILESFELEETGEVGKRLGSFLGRLV